MCVESAICAAYLMIAQLKTESTSSDEHDLMVVLHSQFFRYLGEPFNRHALERVVQKQK